VSISTLGFCTNAGFLLPQARVKPLSKKTNMRARARLALLSYLIEPIVCSLQRAAARGAKMLRVSRTPLQSLRATLPPWTCTSADVVGRRRSGRKRSRRRQLFKSRRRSRSTTPQSVRGPDVCNPLRGLAFTHTTHTHAHNTRTKAACRARPIALQTKAGLLRPLQAAHTEGAQQQQQDAQQKHGQADQRRGL
jgi:hypothetical protein